jgi:hypothetical protein
MITLLPILFFGKEKNVLFNNGGSWLGDIWISP